MPVIPEVVYVIKAARIYAESSMQQNVLLIDVLDFFLKVRIRFTVPHTVDDELM